MEAKHLRITALGLLVTLAIATNVPARDYTMVDLKNGLTTELLEIGKTSFTFSVGWQLDMEIDEDTLFLMGKLNIESRGWSFLQALYLDPSRQQGRYPASDWHSCFPKEFDLVQRKAIFEILYSEIAWSHLDWGKERFKEKASFAVRVPIITDSPQGLTRGRYEEDDEQDEEEENQSPVETKNDSHLWLYAGILMGSLCAGFYFLRRKLKTGN